MPRFFFCSLSSLFSRISIECCTDFIHGHTHEHTKEKRLLIVLMITLNLIYKKSNKIVFFLFLHRMWHNPARTVGSTSHRRWRRSRFWFISLAGKYIRIPFSLFVYVMYDADIMVYFLCFANRLTSELAPAVAVVPCSITTTL